MKKEVLREILTILLAVFVFGCAGHRQNSKVYVDDLTTTARIKSDLIRDPVVDGLDIYVSTYEGRVELTGFVATEQQKERAGAIAASQPGVVRVHNDLTVRTGR